MVDIKKEEGLKMDDKVVELPIEIENTKFKL